jgi:methionine-rich copper-binding protein CopC
MWLQPLRACLCAVVATLAMGVLASPGASAHSQLEDSNPRSGDRVNGIVRSITLSFNEDVTLPRVGLRGPKGTTFRVSTRHRGGSTVVSRITPALIPGAYNVLWRVKSADGHWISGVMGFSVVK